MTDRDRGNMFVTFCLMLVGVTAAVIYVGLGLYK